MRKSIEEIEKLLRRLDKRLHEIYPYNSTNREIPKRDSEVDRLIREIGLSGIFENSQLKYLANTFNKMVAGYCILLGYTQLATDIDGTPSYQAGKDYLKLVASEQDYFKNQLRVQPQQTKSSSNKALVISDLHGNMKKWESIKRYLEQNPNTQIIILGDAMDRGKDGVEILLQIKELSEKAPQSIKYIPGNHDIFTYNYLVSNQNSKINLEAKMLMDANGGDSTLRILDILTDKAKEGLTRWLGEQPIQMKKRIGEEDYYFSHAVFDESLYKEDNQFNLKKAYDIRKGYVSERETIENNKTYAKFYNCMWYREKDIRTHRAPLSLPKGLMLIGHTPSNQKIRLEQIQGQQALCVDCGRDDVFQGAKIDEEGITTVTLNDNRNYEER